MICRHPRPPLFPYTTLFRSVQVSSKDFRTGETVTIVVTRDVFAGVIHRLLDDSALQRGIPSFIEKAYNGNFDYIGEFVARYRSEEHTSELQSHSDLVCRLLL